jgi:hypothetical protein
LNHSNLERRFELGAGYLTSIATAHSHSPYKIFVPH